jgi:phosphate transport system substrate-binding protein
VLVNGELVDNPYKSWNEINPLLPNTQILVYGPPPTSGTRDAFIELAMHIGCKTLTNKDSAWINENCSRMRQDGLFVEAGENDNLIVQRLLSDTAALGIFGYSFLYENMDVLKGVDINGVRPSSDTIADFSYPIARPLLFYVKNNHLEVITGLNSFVEEFISDEAIGENGYLSERGLVPLDETNITNIRNNFKK